jgi:hypothetical protein
MAFQIMNPESGAIMPKNRAFVNRSIYMFVIEFLRMSQHDTCKGEQEYLGETRKRIEGKIRALVEEVFERYTEPDRRAQELVEKVEPALSSTFAAMYLDVGQRDEIRESLRAAAHNLDPVASMNACTSTLRPLIELIVSRAKEFEDLQAQDTMRRDGFTPLNERISYSVGEHSLQLHLAPAREVKGRIEAMYQDALEKIVPIVQANPDIWVIGGTSWINATNTYGAMKERLGFTLSDTPEDVVREHFADETRPLKDATMTREEFLARYASK